MHESVMFSWEQARLFSVRMVSRASLPVSTTESYTLTSRAMSFRASRSTTSPPSAKWRI